MMTVLRKLAGISAATKWVPFRTPTFVLALGVALTAPACSSSSTTSTAPSTTKCAITLATSPAALARTGGTGTVTVTTTAECAWTASSEASWIAGVAPASGQGAGQVEFRVSANPAATARLGDIVVNTDRIQVRQDASACGFELATRSQTFSETGGAGTVTLSSAPDGCAWAAVSNVTWVTITSGDSGTGNSTIRFQVQANNGSERSGSLTIAGQTFTVRQGGTALSCAFALSPLTQTIGAAGGAGTPVSVSSASACAWAALADVPWITVPAGASGSGNGTIAFSVAANPGAARSGSVTITGGQQFTVNQAAALAPTCSYTVSPDSRSIGAAGGPGTPVAVSTAPGCAWSASAGVSWITVTGGSGSGSGTVAFSVAANTGAARSGIVTVTGGQRFTVNQAAVPPPPCSYSISPARQAFDESGGNGTVSVSTAAGCQWAAVSNDTWIRVTSGANSSGNGNVGFSVMPNDDKNDKKREGTITIAGHPFTVSQSNK